MAPKVGFVARVQVVSPGHPVEVWVFQARKEDGKLIVTILGRFPVLAIAVGQMAEATVSFRGFNPDLEFERSRRLYETFYDHVLCQFDRPGHRPVTYVLVPDHIGSNPWVEIGRGPQSLYKERYQTTGAFFTREALEYSIKLAKVLFAKEGIPVEVYEPDSR